MPKFPTTQYKLSERQKVVFTDTVDIYVRQTLSQTGVMANTADIEPYPAYRDVPCKHLMTDELSAPDVLGITNRDNMDVIDKFRFNYNQSIEMGWIIRLTTPGSPNYGLFWACQGNPRTKPPDGERDCASRKVYALRVPPPAGVPPMSPVL